MIGLCFSIAFIWTSAWVSVDVPWIGWIGGSLVMSVPAWVFVAELRSK